jgi:hypothetical protein
MPAMSPLKTTWIWRWLRLPALRPDGPQDQVGEGVGHRLRGRPAQHGGAVVEGPGQDVEDQVVVDPAAHLPPPGRTVEDLHHRRPAGKNQVAAQGLGQLPVAAELAHQPPHDRPRGRHARQHHLEDGANVPGE